MTLGHSALLKRAAQLELKQSKKINLDCPFLSALEVLLIDVYGILRPRPSDYEKRRLLVHIFNEMTRGIYGSSNGFPIIEAFGSFVMDLFTAGSDLDLSINFSNDYTSEFPRDKKISMLRKFAKFLYARQARGQVSGVQSVMRARVPVLKVVDCETGVECDISVENKDGITRSLILTTISSLDERFRILSYLMKVWANAHDINSSKHRTMNSLTVISLVAIHLQTRDPPILPPFSTLFKDGTDSLSIQNAFHRFRSSGGRNEETVSRLFVTLLSKLSSVESLWQHGLCASTYEGSWISKTWESKVAFMSAEDFLDRSQNFARAVSKDGKLKINKCILSTVKHLSRFMDGQMEAPKLKQLLFGSIPLTIPSDEYIPREGTDLKRKPLLPPPVEPVPVTALKRKPLLPPPVEPVPVTALKRKPLLPPPVEPVPVTDLKRKQLLPPPVEPVPVTTKRAQYSAETTGLHHFPHENQVDNRFPNPPIPCGPSLPHAGSGPQQPRFLFPQSGYGSGPRQPELPFASRLGYGHGPQQPEYHFVPQSGYGPGPKQDGFPITPQSGYGPGRQQPEFPFSPQLDHGPRPQHPDSRVGPPSDYRPGPQLPQFPFGSSSGYRPQQPQFQSGPPNSGYWTEQRQFQSGPPNSGYLPEQPQCQSGPPNSGYRSEQGQFQSGPPNSGHRQEQRQFQSGPPNSGYRSEQGQFQSEPPNSGYRPEQHQFQSGPPNSGYRPEQHQFQSGPPNSGYRPEQPQFQSGPSGHPNSGYRPQQPQFNTGPPNSGYWPEQPQFQSGHPNSDYRPQQPQFNTGPPNSSYGPEHHGPHVAPPQFHHEWHHNQPGQNQMFR